MIINSLEVNNVCGKTRAIQFTPEINLVTGGNGAGKTSAYQTIMALLCGGTPYGLKLKDTARLVSGANSYAKLQCAEEGALYPCFTMKLPLSKMLHDQRIAPDWCDKNLAIEDASQITSSKNIALDVMTALGYNTSKIHSAISESEDVKKTIRKKFEKLTGQKFSEKRLFGAIKGFHGDADRVLEMYQSCTQRDECSVLLRFVEDHALPSNIEESIDKLRDQWNKANEKTTLNTDDAICVLSGTGITLKDSSLYLDDLPIELCSYGQKSYVEAVIHSHACVVSDIPIIVDNFDWLGINLRPRFLEWVSAQEQQVILFQNREAIGEMEGINTIAL